MANLRIVYATISIYGNFYRKRVRTYSQAHKRTQRSLNVQLHRFVFVCKRTMLGEWLLWATQRLWRCGAKVHGKWLVSSTLHCSAEYGMRWTQPSMVNFKYIHQRMPRTLHSTSTESAIGWQMLWPTQHGGKEPACLHQVLSRNLAYKENILRSTARMTQGKEVSVSSCSHHRHRGLSSRMTMQRKFWRSLAYHFQLQMPSRQKFWRQRWDWF